MMEAIAIHEVSRAHTKQEFGIQLQYTIDQFHKIERILDEKVRLEINSLINKHAHIQNEINR